LKSVIILLLICSIYFSCNNKESDQITMEKYKREIRDTELAFAKLAKEQGLKVAFTTYAADDAVINRGNNLIKGRKAIEDYYDNQNLDNVKLEWDPEFIEVAESGDLGYTYGPYTFTSVDSSRKETKSKGIFHTVWKKQVDGKWRFVWD
jgi:ketosteroid isomerase-like protein